MDAFIIVCPYCGFTAEITPFSRFIDRWHVLCPICGAVIRVPWERFIRQDRYEVCPVGPFFRITLRRECHYIV